MLKWIVPLLVIVAVAVVAIVCWAASAKSRAAAEDYRTRIECSAVRLMRGDELVEKLLPGETGVHHYIYAVGFLRNHGGGRLYVDASVHVEAPGCRRSTKVPTKLVGTGELFVVDVSRTGDDHFDYGSVRPEVTIDRAHSK
jgi:hypothetical protein